MSIFPHTDKAQTEAGDLPSLALINLVIVGFCFLSSLLDILFLDRYTMRIVLGLLFVVNGGYFLHYCQRIKQAAALDEAERLAATQVAIDADSAKKEKKGGPFSELFGSKPTNEAVKTDPERVRRMIERMKRRS